MNAHTPMGPTVFSVMTALAQMEPETKRERVTDSVAEWRAAGKDRCGRHPTFTDSQIRNVIRLVEAEKPATQAAHELGMSRVTLYRPILELSDPVFSGGHST